MKPAGSKGAADMGEKRVTMKDVAMELGVSVVSVSKALSGKEGVSLSLREKIITLAKDMGYVPRKKRTWMNHLTLNIAIIIPERLVVNNVFYFKIYQKMLMKLSEKGYIGILEIISKETEEVGELPNVMRVSGISQIVVIGEMKTLFLDMLVHTGVGIIFFDFQKEKFDVDCIVGDNENSGFLLTRYLIKCGYKKIGFAGSYLYTRKRQECFLGYLKYLMRKKQVIDPNWWIDDRDARGRHIALTLPENMPEAFVCCSDEAAYYLLQALEQEGYSVPEDVGVVGYGECSEYSRLNTTLTTYRADVDEMIDQCIHIVEQRALGKEYRRGTSVVHGQIVIRDSARMKKGIVQ